MGVEFAIAAHEALLSFGGALPASCRLRNHAAFPTGDAVQALVIDDLVSLCCLPSSADPRGPSAARDLHNAACDLYDRFEVLGSPEKDVYGETLFQAIGTEIDSRPSSVRAGIVTSAAPLARRTSLALLSLRAARLPVTTPGLVARLTGAWTSTFLYRRCCMVVLAEAYRVANLAATVPAKSREPLRLSRRLAQELVLCAVLSPIAATDLTAKQSEEVYATDASLARGAACRCVLPLHAARSLWQNGDRRGAYSRLEEGPQVLLKAAGLAPCAEDVDEAPISRPLRETVPFSFDVIEVGCCQGLLGGPGPVEGLDLSPCFSPGTSRHFDLLVPDFLLWLCEALAGGYTGGLLLHPAGVCCGSGPPRAYALRALAAFRVSAGFSVPSVLLLPCSVLPELGGHLHSVEGLCSTPPFRLGWLDGAGASRLCLCLCSLAETGPLQSLGLPGDSPPDLCCASGLPDRQVFGKVLRDSFSLSLTRRDPVPAAPGLESVAVNDVLSGAAWEVTSVIPWRGASHINVLELAVIVALHRQLAVSAPDARHTVLVDSQVAKSAAAKGRSASRALGYALARSAAIQLGFGLFFAYGFAPTRLNIADDPTRFAELRAPTPFRLFEALTSDEWHTLSARRFRRPSASWLRLVLLLLAFLPSGSSVSLGCIEIGQRPPWLYVLCFGPFPATRACSHTSGFVVELCPAPPFACACSHLPGLVVEPPLALPRAPEPPPPHGSSFSLPFASFGSSWPCGGRAPSWLCACSQALGLVVELPPSTFRVEGFSVCACSHLGLVVEPSLAFPRAPEPSPPHGSSFSLPRVSLGSSWPCGGGAPSWFCACSHAFGLVVELPSSTLRAEGSSVCACSHLGLVVEPPAVHPLLSLPARSCAAPWVPYSRCSRSRSWRWTWLLSVC